ncbi:DNA polymerase phi [Marchantia polymorpha subsp. ruderalis]|uniref:DNA polymerase V n=2 Tax=Marchantia polymorpha TaxID=3197 RepID=A0AAF6BFS3_MARPO|nr:hypothetical protein MARPO_0136s0021 [Marchantia polymorpha]BBN10857.1 hypothetical protein Mp_5g07000 [Marchantia polymorpha subsp. ruderalis]|eukprot:PTQ29693.1 hypothetical protein MARPO_0136s0021 [Marchantia polymorpha]
MNRKPFTAAVERKKSGVMKKKTRVEAPLPSSNGSTAAPASEEEPFSNGGSPGKVSKKKMKVDISPSPSKAANKKVHEIKSPGNGVEGGDRMKHKKKHVQKEKSTSSNGSLDAAVDAKPVVKGSKGVKGNKKKGPKVKADESPALPSNVAGDTSVVSLKGSSLLVKAGAAPEPVGMQIYWNLSSVEASVREVASLALVKELTAAQKDYEERGLGKEERAAEAVILGEGKVEEDGLEDCSPAVQYALRRLVRGVASSRESSRQGFALALAAVLGTVPCIEGAAVIKLIEKNLEVGASMKGPEVRDALLGQLFAYGALVRSARLIGEASMDEQQELAKEVTQQLLLLAKKKAFLREPATYLVAELGEKLGAQGLEKGLCAAPLFSEFMSAESDSFSPDTLLLALRLHKKLPPSVRSSCSLIPESGNFGDMFEPRNLPRLVTCLQESSCSHPRVHSVWHYLLEILFAQQSSQAELLKPSKKGRKKRSLDTESNLETKIATFWSVVVEGALITSSHERKHLAMQLALLFLQRLPALTYAKYILSKNFVTCLLDSTASKDNLLFKAAQQCIGDMCLWAKSGEDRCIQLILAFQSHSDGKFDHLTKTQSIRTLLSGLSTISSYQTLYKALVDFCSTAENIDEGAVRGVGTGSKKQKIPAEDASDGEGSDDEKAGDNGRRKWAMDLLRVLPQQAWTKLKVNIVVEELVMKHMPSLTPAKPLTENEQQSVDKLKSVLLQLSTALDGVESADQKERLQAMISIIVQLLFESLLTPNVAVESAPEISICCKKAFGDLVDVDVDSDTEEGSEAPAFMDVLVDLLLSLLAESSAPVRLAAEQVFKSFSGELTSSGLADMLRIVKKNSTPRRHKPLVEVENVKDDDEEIVDVEDSDDEMGEDGDDDDAEDGGSDENDSDQEDDDTSRKDGGGVVGVLGDAKNMKNEDDDEEDEDSEMSDLDDEAMFKFDKHLAVILKHRKQGGTDGTDDAKDAQTQLMHFKFRVLALLEFFVQKQSDNLLVLTILPSLLHVFVNSCTTDGNSQVADRVASILLQKLFKGKHYPKSSQVDQSALKDLLKKALKLASRSTIKRVCNLAENCTYWLLKVILGNADKEQDKEVEEILLLALEDFFEHKKCKLSSDFFKQCCTRFPSLGNCLLGSILEKCVSARLEHLQLEALRLASAILGLSGKKFARKAKLLTAEEAKARADFLKPHIGSLSATVLSLLKNPPTKAAKRAEVIQFSVAVVELYRSVFPEKSLSEFINSDVSAAAIEALNTPALPKGRLSNLVVKLQELLGPKS